MSAQVELRSVAAEALKHAKGNPLRTATKLASAVRPRPDLLEALALFYVQRELGVTEMPTKPTRVPTVYQHKKRTPSEKAAALQAAGEIAQAVSDAYDYQIDGRPIGSMRWGEILNLCDRKLASGVSYLRLSAKEMGDYLLLAKIRAHCQVSDHSTELPKILTRDKLQDFIDTLPVDVPRFIGVGMDAAADSIESALKKKVLS